MLVIGVIRALATHKPFFLVNFMTTFIYSLLQYMVYDNNFLSKTGGFLV